MAKSETKLDFFASLPTHTSKVDIEDAKIILECFRKHITPGSPVNYKNVTVDVGKILKKDMSESWVKNFLAEIKKAARNDYTLETYFEAGRPYRPGYQEAGSKKKPK